MSDTERHGALIIAQARFNSTRLPGKVLMPMGSSTLIGLIARRLGRFQSSLVVATSVEPTDDPIAAHCAQEQLQCVRGDLDNVLQRFVHVIERSDDPELVVRLTADNPMVDEALIDVALDAMRRREAGTRAVSNHLPDHRRDPYGYGAEVVESKALRDILATSDAPRHLEHVTLALVEEALVHPYHRFDLSFEEAKAMRWTVDTDRDYRYMCRLFESCGDGVSGPQALEWTRRHPHPDSVRAGDAS